MKTELQRYRSGLILRCENHVFQSKCLSNSMFIYIFQILNLLLIFYENCLLYNL